MDDTGCCFLPEETLPVGFFCEPVARIRRRDRQIEVIPYFFIADKALYQIFHSAARLAVQACGESHRCAEGQPSLFASGLCEAGNPLREESNPRQNKLGRMSISSSFLVISSQQHSQLSA